MRLLVTRPEPDNERTAARLRAAGHEVLLTPLLRFEALPGARWSPGPFAAVLVTSANAMRALSGHPGRDGLRDVPVFAVGERSAEAARACGFTRVRSAGGNAADLAKVVSAELAGDPQRLLHLAGEDHLSLVPELAEGGTTVETAVVYRMAPAPELPAEVRAPLGAGSIDGVLHFSARSAEAYVAALRAANIERPGLAPAQFCLSAAVAAPLGRAGAARIAIAARPNEDALLGLIPDA